MIVYRSARIGDLTAVAEIYRKALEEIYERHGFLDEVLLPHGMNPFYAFVLREEPDGFFVAEESGRIIGAAFSWIRENLWFLSHLFILPQYQGKGVGKNLLARTLEYSKTNNISTHCVITMAFNTSSVSLYLQNRMYPLQSIFLFTAAGKTKSLSSHDDAISCEYADSASWNRQVFNSIDREVLGFSRPGHHRYFVEDQKIPCLLFRDKSGDPAAYAYVWPDGRIGPVAALREAPFEQILRMAVGHAEKYATHLTMMIPGANTEAMEAALAMGFRIRLPYVLLSSRPFGSWSSYLFHSPGLM
jgi:GNAT superfamily N-acetyltransferase